MEIERKWLVSDWPSGLPCVREHFMRQGYLVVRPTVRIREEALLGGDTSYILCIKSGSGIARHEIEVPLMADQFRELEEVIGLPLIPKLRKSYQLPEGHILEVNLVDEGLPTEYMYAEVEFDSVEEANAFEPEDPALREYLSKDVTHDPQQTMGAYWILTRMKKSDA